MDENEKTRRLLEQRAAIQEQRKAANMQASMYRDRVSFSSYQRVEREREGETSWRVAELSR